MTPFDKSKQRCNVLKLKTTSSKSDQNLLVPMITLVRNHNQYFNPPKVHNLQGFDHLQSVYKLFLKGVVRWGGVWGETAEFDIELKKRV